jgi:hypothetical protein
MRPNGICSYWLDLSILRFNLKSPVLNFFYSVFGVGVPFIKGIYRGRQVRIPFGEIFLFRCWSGWEAIRTRFWTFGQNRISSSNIKSNFRKKNFFLKKIHKYSKNCSFAAEVVGWPLEVDLDVFAIFVIRLEPKVELSKKMFLVKKKKKI